VSSSFSPISAFLAWYFSRVGSMKTRQAMTAATQRLRG
jgi:hypothetical protein